MRALILTAALAALAGCGADGDPIRPDPEVTTRLGVGIGTDGLTVTRSTTVATRRGPVTVGVTF